MAASLVFGALNLMGATGDSTYLIQAEGEGTDWGNPVPITEAVTSFLQDGAIIGLTGHDNRDLTLVLRISAANGAALAAAELALMLECAKVRNTLTWTPPSSGAEPCVFDVVLAELDHALNDLGEISNSLLRRSYTLKLTALPFARAAELVSETILSESAVPSETVIDDCTSTSGWTGSPTPVTAGAGQVRTNRTAGAGPYVWLQRTGLSATAKTYLRIGAGVINTNTVLTFTINGTVMTPIVTQAELDGTAYWFDTSALTTINTVRVDGALFPPDTSNYLYIYEISTNTAAGSTGRQRARTINISGSARTPASLAVTSDAGTSLGSVLVHTMPTATSLAGPDLMRYLSSGNARTTDSTLVTGAHSDFSVLHTFDLAASGVPQGGYLLLARVKHATAGSFTVTWSAKSLMGSTADSGESGTTDVTVPGGTAWAVATLAAVTLPTRDLGSAGMVRIGLQGASGMTLDEAWLFNIETGRLTWVECGAGTAASGGPASKLWLDSASLDNPEPSIWMGTQSDRSDAMGAAQAILAFGAHEFEPPSVNLFAVTTHPADAAIDLSHYPRFHTHVA